MSMHHEDEQMRALLASLDTIDPVSRNIRPRSTRRPVLMLAVVCGALAVGGAAIAAGLGAFSGRPVDDLQACKATTTALTTASGGSVLTGHTDAGVYCVAYADANGAKVGTAGDFDTSPDGKVIALEALDTASNTYVVAGVVAPGYDAISIGGQKVPITNHAFVVDRKTGLNPGTLSGPAGAAAIDLSHLEGGGS